jgi:hypothetical protein
MRPRLTTRVGKQLYKLRQQTIEPVFGILKSVMGFGQFRSRGRQKVSLEWTLVYPAYTQTTLPAVPGTGPGDGQLKLQGNEPGHGTSSPASGAKAGGSGWRNCAGELNPMIPTLQPPPQPQLPG